MNLMLSTRPKHYSTQSEQPVVDYVTGKMTLLDTMRLDFGQTSETNVVPRIANKATTTEDTCISNASTVSALESTPNRPN